MTKATRKVKERELRRNDIINAAEMLIFSKGYENVSMNDIANQAEMARGTIYQYFINKDDIYAAIAIRAANILSETFIPIIEKENTGIEKIKTICLLFYDFYKKNTGYYNAYYNTMMFDYKNSTNLEELMKIRRETFNIVVKIINEGIEDGTIRKDVDPAVTTLFMLSISYNVNNLIPVTRMYMNDYDLDQDMLFERSLDLALHSIESN